MVSTGDSKSLSLSSNLNGGTIKLSNMITEKTRIKVKILKDKRSEVEDILDKNDFKYYIITYKGESNLYFKPIDKELILDKVKDLVEK